MAIRVFLTWLVLHFLLIFSVACQETFWLIRHGLTLLPSSFKSEGREAGGISAQDRPPPNLLRKVLASYAGLAGIDAGYGYFAPNVPGTYRLSFELHHADGRVERILPQVHSFSAGLRMAGLLDQIGRTRSGPLREHMVKMLAQSVWRTHPDVKTMRALLEEISLPSAEDFQHGKTESLHSLYAYDFSLVAEPARPTNR